jgi:lipopolysaccharide export system permease protein
MPTKPTPRHFKLLRLDFYILSEVLTPFFGAIVILIFVLLMFQALRLADNFIVHGAPGLTLLKMTVLLSLSFMPMVLPMAFLISVLMAFGRLSGDSELVAMKANGLSIYRLSTPVFGFAAVTLVLSIFLNLNWAPWCEREYKNTLIKVLNTKAVASIHEGAFNSGFFDLLIFADKVDVKTNHLSRVFIYDEREPKSPLTVVASEGEILPVKSASELGNSVVLRLKNGSIHQNDIEADSYQKGNFGEYMLYLKIDEGAGDSSIKPTMIPYNDLLARIASTNLSTYDGREMRGELWRRFAIASTPIAFVLLGIGFGTVRTRSVRAGAFLTFLAVILTYYSFLSWGMIRIHEADLPPWFAMFLPNFLALGVGTFVFRRSSW